MTLNMTSITVDAQFKDMIRNGEKTEITRRGWREFDLAPMLIQYTDGDTDRIEVMAVEHSRAKYLGYFHFQALRRFHPDLVDEDEVTTLKWVRLGG